MSEFPEWLEQQLGPSLSYEESMKLHAALRTVRTYVPDFEWRMRESLREYPTTQTYASWSFWRRLRYQMSRRG